MKLPICLLVDNGSLRPEAIFSLRRVAKRLSKLSDFKVIPVGLLHSNKIKSSDLNGENAETVGSILADSRKLKEDNLLVLPLFLGPSLGVTDWLVGKLKHWKVGKLGRSYEILDCLYQNDDVRLAEALASEVKRVTNLEGFLCPKVALVDHGTPIAEVNQVREKVGFDLRVILEIEESNFSTCSMERRKGSEYSFNEPLLEDLLLKWASAGATKVVVALFFLLSGRHAGKNGDLVKICERVKKKFPKMRIILTNPLAEHELIFAILKDRLDEFKNSNFIQKG